jgi:hypothetical protein
MARDEAYFYAERRIGSTIRSKEIELNLSNMGLSELPPSISNLSHLQILHLRGNKFTELPESLSKLTHLKKLYLAENQISKLPKWIVQLTDLITLSLSNNNLTFLDEKIFELTQLQSLDLASNNISMLTEQIGNLVNLKLLDISNNQLLALPESLGNLQQLGALSLNSNKLVTLPESLGNLQQLNSLNLSNNRLMELPELLGDLTELRLLDLTKNNLTDLPASLGQLHFARAIRLDSNPLNPELLAAFKEGAGAIRAYLRSKAAAQITLNEAKLILIGEGEVGKTCLMDALQGRPWQEHETTHGIEIRSVVLTDLESNREITLNGWDFGGQRVYRPTHQLFFSSPAVYLVVWKPREGPQQGFVKEWIKLIKHREPDAKIIVAATHGGPQQRQPDIDRQELWDLFGKETVIDFFFVDSKPDENGQRRGIEELKDKIAHVAAGLPEVGRSVPKRWQEVRDALETNESAYLPREQVLYICKEHQMEDAEGKLFITLEHRLGHLIHYEHDTTLRDIVVLKPDWLATSISFVLDDEETRLAHGLVPYSHLGQLWSDTKRKPEERYPAELHPIFLRLMERFDLSYRVAVLHPAEQENGTSLIAQLVPDTTPQEALEKVWLSEVSAGDIQQIQICKIVDEKGQSATAEGLFYQLIVRLHKYSLGRDDYYKSVHWQRGLVLDDEYNGRALLRHVDNDVHISVRAPYPERFLAMLTEEVRYLVESFWEGLRCDVMVPCLNETPCIGLFEVRKLMENKRRGRPEQPCSVCNEWQDIEQLLHNAPAATQPISLDKLMKDFSQVKDTLNTINDNTRRILSQVDKNFDDLIHLFTDEAKEGPRLFSFFPMDGNKFNPQTWVRAKFRLVLWCEHSRLPLPAINGIDSKKGVYDLEFDREWFRQAVPYLKFLTGTLSLVLPVMSSTFKVINDTALKTLENQLSLGKDVIDAIAGEGAALHEVMEATYSTNLERNVVGHRAENATLRELHALLKEKEPGFGGLVRVMNKRQEFLWVHERFAGEY